MTPSEFNEAKNAFCARYGASETSGWRSPGRNALPEIDGATHSQHMLGKASDVVYAPNPKPAKAAALKTANQLGLHLIRYNSHDHLQALQ